MTSQGSPSRRAAQPNVAAAEAASVILILDMVVVCKRQCGLGPPAGLAAELHTLAGLDCIMLELRPTCENCNEPLPPGSLEARICSFECTFCARCVEEVLGNVCPNCGGGLCPRPVRPSKNWKGRNFLGARPASLEVTHRPVDRQAHALFSASIGSIPPHER